MRQVREELRRRAKVIRHLPADVCPDNKVTPALADRKSLGLHPVVIGVDECQVWFEHPQHGAEFDEICTDLVKRGPALGIVLLLATQRPDAKAIPTGIGANASMRYCLKVGGQVENDMVLGTSAYKNGVRATTFAWADKGIGYFVGEGADARIVKSVYKDAPATKKFVARIRAMREALGLLTGYAAGETPDATGVSGPRVDVLGDVAAVFAGADKLWSTVVLARLGELRPEFYGTWTPKVLADALKPYGLAAGQVWDDDGDGRGRNRNGYTAAAVHAALAERGDDPGANGTPVHTE
jgi:S-DNA-T family DNA segregation ATPase FtsK/SpoIIIE